MSGASLHARVRCIALLVVATAAITAATSPATSRAAAAPPRRLAADLALATGLAVTGDVVFERVAPLGLRDAALGATVLFTARTTPDAPRDVWRARVRVTPGGRLLALSGPVNLTRSAIGDDGPLVADGAPREGVRRVAFVTRAFGQVQSAAVLDGRGDEASEHPLRAGVTRLLETLSWRGVARWDLRLDTPALDARVALSGDTVTVRAAGRWRADLARDRVEPPAGATLTRQQWVEKPLVHWAVDTVRGLSWVGPAPIAWLEERVFHARDVARRAAWRWFGARPSTSTAASQGSADETREGRVITAAPRDERDPGWPPPDIAPPLARTLGRERGEGVWVDASPAWLRRIPGAPPAFVRTSLRLDAERPYTRVVLVAFDLRQVQLAMQAGVEDPVPLVGPRGDGRIPRDPALLGRVVAAFNGAFKTEHGEYGMVVDRRVLLPPRPNAATVATLVDGTVAMGTWGRDPALPDALVSLRQNLDPLVADGVENPTRRGLWGFVLGGVESMPTVRSGLCMRPEGAALYVWGEETTARLLGRAMRLAGCSYGMHLDMNPGHGVFHFLRVGELRARDYQHQALASGMHSGPERFLYRSPKDFFYLTLRDPSPPSAALAWRPAETQPAPRWQPALWTASRGDVTVTAVALSRVTLALRAGLREPLAPALRGQHETLAAPQGRHLLGALHLGVAPGPAAPRGLVVDGRVLLPFVALPGHARFEVQRGAAIAFEHAVAPAVDAAVQGVALVDDGRPTALDPSDVAPRTALGLTRDGWLLHATGRCARDELQRAMVAAGAWRAALFEHDDDAGGAHWGEALRDAYPGTTLFVLDREAPSPVARLEPLLGSSAVAQPAAQAVQARP